MKVIPAMTIELSSCALMNNGAKATSSSASAANVRACTMLSVVDTLLWLRGISRTSWRRRIRPEMTPVGRYAVQIGWSDGHSTGIYSWDLLLKLEAESARTPEVR